MLYIRLEENNKLIDEKSKNFDSIEKENEEIKNKNQKLEEQMIKVKNDNESFLSTITHLKLELKELRENLNGEQRNKDKVKDEIIEMKKEIKVLRRERDHYKNIIKDKDLL